MEKCGEDTGNKLLFSFQQHDAEWVCTLKATQLLFLFSRDDVCLFYTMLQDAVSKLKHLNPVSPKDEGCLYELAEKTLQEKIHFMPLSTHVQFPAAIEFSEHSFDLTGDELMALIIQVMFLVQDLEMEEAEWCFASHSSGGSCHLVKKKARSRRGPVLCGCLPPPPSEISHVNGWMVQPVIGPVEEKNLCPTCLHLWKMEPMRVPLSIEQGISNTRLNNV